MDALSGVVSTVDLQRRTHFKRLSLTPSVGSSYSLIVSPVSANTLSVRLYSYLTVEGNNRLLSAVI